MTIPEGFTTVTPYLATNDAKGAIAQYEKALGAELLGAIEMPDGSGKIMHATLKIGSSMVYISDPFDADQPVSSKDNPSPVGFYLYFDDCDAAYKNACDGGMTSMLAPEDTFWGDRWARVTDSYGFIWSLATRIRDVSPEEIQEAMKAMKAMAE